jgi:hypothetical protein
MTERPREIADAQSWSAERFRADIVEQCRPVVLRGLAADWPMVRAAARSPEAFRDYILSFDNGGRMEAFFGARSIAGNIITART